MFLLYNVYEKKIFTIEIKVGRSKVTYKMLGFLITVLGIGVNCPKIKIYPNFDFGAIYIYSSPHDWGAS